MVRDPGGRYSHLEQPGRMPSAISVFVSVANLRSHRSSPGLSGGSDRRDREKRVPSLSPGVARAVEFRHAAGLTIVPTSPVPSPVFPMPRWWRGRQLRDSAVRGLFSNDITININVQATTDNSVFSESTYSIITSRTPRFARPSWPTIRLTIPATNPAAGNPSWW